ncbi:MAG: hypothetical protein KKF77_16245 [Proteobacteria bacterium]|nr:hypothetical protein [Pseudomonadota bacterium]
MDFVFWTRTLFLLTLPAFLYVMVASLLQIKRKSGQFPTYWTCAHAAGFVVFLVMAFGDNHRVANGVYVFLSLFAIYWAAAIKIGLDWWKARRLKATQPE